MAIDWGRKFREPILLRAGAEKLATLGEASRFISRSFGGVTHWPPLAAAVDVLLKAAESGKAIDIATARSKVELVLRLRNML